MIGSFTHSRIWVSVALIHATCLLCPAAEARAPSAPNPSAIFEQARIAESSVVYSENFDGPDAPSLKQIYGGDTPNKVVYSGTTEEQAFSGKQSYKIALTFEPVADKVGAAYFLLPIEIPAWSNLKLRWRFKSEVLPQAKIRPFHGFIGGNLEVGESRNVASYVGHKTGESEGWETWEATARKTGKIGEHVAGAAVYFQIDEVEVATTVTFYIDDVQISSRLPVNWREIWAGAARYFREVGDKDKRSQAVHRLTAVKQWYSDARSRREQCTRPRGGAPLLLEQFERVTDKIDNLLERADPLIKKIEAGLADTEKSFNVNVNAAERLVFEARHQVSIAESYGQYDSSDVGSDILTFGLDPTQCYPILPTGPTAHVDETSYYNWNQKTDSFENPQILPETNPVPAPLARTLSNFGCRGTYVPYSFAIHTGRDLRELTLSSSDLESSNGMIPSSAMDLRIVGPWYRPYGGKLRLMNEPLLHDPQFAEPVTGEGRNKFKDPRYGDDADTLLPVTIPAGTTRQFYALVKVPSDALPGIYNGRIDGKALDGRSVHFSVELEVLPFELLPTPFAYSAFYRSYLADEATKQEEGIHSKRKTPAQMEAELINMGEHGLNTLNLYAGTPQKTEDGWTFDELDQCLAMAKQAGLIRSPFTWLGHSLNLAPVPGRKGAETVEEIVERIDDLVPAVNRFCRERGYPQPAFFGADEASGEELARMKPGYEAVNRAGGILTVACYSDYWANLGEILSLPIVYGGAASRSTRDAIRQSQAAGLETWIYNCPSTNLPATPSVYRRRYGLALWRLGENGAAPWEYSGVQYTKESYEFEPDTPVYAFAFPTWSGKPIDSIVFEAYREGIYDTRYVVTLQHHLKRVKESKANKAVTDRVDQWLANFSIHDDLQVVRRQMADFIVALTD